MSLVRFRSAIPVILRILNEYFNSISFLDEDIPIKKSKNRKNERDESMAVIRKNSEDFGVRRSSRGPPILVAPVILATISNRLKSKIPTYWTVDKYISGLNRSIPNVEVSELPYQPKKSITVSVRPIPMMNLPQPKSRYDSYHWIIPWCEWSLLIILYLGRNWGRQNWKGVGCPWRAIRVHW